MTCADVFVQIVQSSCTKAKTVHAFYKTASSLHLGTRLLAKTKPNSVFLQLLCKFSRLALNIKEALPEGGPMSPVWILKRLVSVFVNACRLLSALPSLLQFGWGRLSLVAISFYALSLLFGSCRLSEFTLAGPHKKWKLPTSLASLLLASSDRNSDLD